MKIILFIFIGITMLFSDVKKITLEEAISIALENNKNQKLSKLGLDLAQAQYEQALSTNYPTINAILAGKRINEDRDFAMKGAITLPSNFAALLNGAASQNPNLAGQNFSSLPLDTKVKAYGKDTVKGSLNLQYVLYSGGKISSIINQAKLNKLLAMNTIKKDEQELIFNVKKYFYAYILTNELYTISRDTLDNMEYVADLTKDFYEMGDSLNVKKTDYLSIQVTVALLKSLVAKLDANKVLINSAFVNTLGMPFNSQVKIKYNKNDYIKPKLSLDSLVKEAYEKNRDIKKLQLALNVSKEQIKEKKADHLPSIALMADIAHTYNSYEYGILSEEQENTWSLGAAVNVPLFSGFKTSAEIKEKKVEQKKLILLQDILKEGLALQVKNELSNAMISYKQMKVLKDAKAIASDNRKLNIKAYQIDAVEPEKVIEAQYIEAYVKADYLKYVHDYLISLAKIEHLVGKEINKK